jgi:hypothetical protein
MYVLIADRDAGEYEQALAPKFPGVEFHSVTQEEDIRRRELPPRSSLT